MTRSKVKVMEVQKLPKNSHFNVSSISVHQKTNGELWYSKTGQISCIHPHATSCDLQIFSVPPSTYEFSSYEESTGSTWGYLLVHYRVRCRLLWMLCVVNAAVSQAGGMQCWAQEVQPRQQESSRPVCQLLWSERKADQEKRRDGPSRPGLVSLLIHLFCVMLAFASFLY